MEVVPAGKDLPKDENTLADPAWGRDERIELVRIGPKFFQTEKGKPFAKAAVQRSRAALDDPAFKGPLDLRGADAERWIFDGRLLAEFNLSSSTLKRASFVSAHLTQFNFNSAQPGCR